MNVALSILLVVTFLLPGLIFRRFYYSEEFSKESFKESFFQVLYTAFFPSLILYVFWIWVVSFWGYVVDFRLIGQLLSTNSNSTEEVFINVNNHQKEISIFHLLLYSSALISGLFLRIIIRSLGIDKKVKLFRYQNSWHYLFTGEYIDFRRSTSFLNDHTTKDIEVTYIDILLQTKEGSILYEGILDDYEVKKDGSLDYVILTEIQRRSLKKDSRSLTDILLFRDSHYEIPGHALMIPAEQILNINFTYFGLDYNESSNEIELFQVE